MFQEEIENRYLVNIKGTSDGAQLKFFKDGFWYKQDYFCGEGKAETLTTILLDCSSLDKEEYVSYEYGFINGKEGCRSRNFLKSGEELISLYRFYEVMTGKKLNQDISFLETPEERADFVVSFFKKEAGLDLTDYFAKIFQLDSIIVNEDRHFNNLAIIRTADGTYKPAPIFDNGKSLLVGNYSAREHLSAAENRKRTMAQPFSGSFTTNRKLFGDGFYMDFDRCFKMLKDFPDCQEKEVLLAGLIEEKIIQEEKIKTETFEEKLDRADKMVSIEVKNNPSSGTGHKKERILER